MKKGLLLVIFSVGLFFLSACQKQVTPPSTVAPIVTTIQESPSENLQKLLQNGALIKVPDSNATVVAKARVTQFGKMGDDQDPYGSVAFIDQSVSLATGEIVTFFALNNGGSGDLIYLTAFTPKGNLYEMTDAVLLGDRIKLKSLTNIDNHIAVSYLDHGPDQAMVDDPNVSVDRKFDYQNSKLVEIKK